MERITIKGGHGQPLTYKITEDGTAYHEETSMSLVADLEHIRKSGQRVRLYLGDPKTGKAWGDVETGYIGRSYGGRISVPIVLSKRNSTGGGALLDHCVIKVEHANKRAGGVIWRA